MATHPVPLHSDSQVAFNCRMFRRLRTWTQTELADRVGLSRQLVSIIERGYVPPRPTLDRLATALGVTRRQLLRPRPRLKPLPTRDRGRAA